jgi:hypothetical protein
MAGDRVAELPDGVPLFVVCVGRKGQGKSELAYVLWDSWERDRIVVDVTGDVGGHHPEPDTFDLEVPPPGHWPTEMQDAEADRLSLRYVPDHSHPDYKADLDRVVGLAFSHGDCLLWVDEIGEVAPSNQVLPNTRRALHMGRHQNLNMIMTGPRPMTIDPLVMAQADVVYAFDLPNPDDRKRLADTIGWDRRDVDDAMAELPDHGYLRFVASEHELAIFPPLPLKKVSKRRRRAQAALEEESDLL